MNNQKVFRKKTFAQTSIAISSKGSSQPRRMIHRAESPIILLDSWGFPEKGKKLFGRGLDRSCAKSTFIYNTTPTIYPRPFFRKNTPIDILCTFLYNYCHMITVSVSYAREKLPELINRAYQGEEFLILKNKIPVAKLTAVTRNEKAPVKKILPQATKVFSHLKGTSSQIVNKWRKEA